ncbi:LacI family transcriptional regulator [Candidatus Bipolaricaulota bacterium]|nr:LacI family transcriptional regulator [Candidatus Bipolaricaulota bacterium]
MNKKKKVTIEDIAEEVGYSTNTVSRALNDKSEIKQETKDLILKTAEEMGYRPNRVAQRMRAQKTGILGVVVANNANPFFSRVVKGIESAAADRGYNIILKDSDESPDKEEEAIKIMLSEQVDGLLISPVNSEKSNITKISEDLPLVSFARHFKGLKIDFVLIDDLKGGYLATKHLIENGYQEIALLNGPLNELSAQERLEGYKKAITESGGEPDPELIYDGVLTMDQGYRAGKKILDSDRTLDAVHTFSDFVALGFMKAAEEASLKIPEDIGIVGFDDIPFCSYSRVPLSTVHVPIKEIGEEAVNILLDRIQNQSKEEDLETNQVRLEPELVVRSSSGAKQFSET